MKPAIVQGFKAFVAQVRENVFELAKTTCEKNGYKVTAVVTEKTKTEKK